jgi:hypothetical protein
MRPDNHRRENAALALAMVAGITLLDIIATGASTARHSSRQGQGRSYGDRSGFPKGVEASRGAARKQLADLRSTPDNASSTSQKPAGTGDR